MNINDIVIDYFYTLWYDCGVDNPTWQCERDCHNCLRSRWMDEMEEEMVELEGSVEKVLERFDTHTVPWTVVNFIEER